MARRSYTPDRIINKLREAGILLSQGATIGEAARKIGVTGYALLSLVTRIRWHED